MLPCFAFHSFSAGVWRLICPWALGLALLVSSCARAEEATEQETPNYDRAIQLMREKKFVRARDELRVIGFTGQVARTSALFNYMMGYSFLGSASDEGEVKPQSQEAVAEDLKSAKEYLLKAKGLGPNPALQKNIEQALTSVDARMRHPDVAPGAPPPVTAPNAVPVPVVKAPSPAPVAGQGTPKLAPLKPRPGYVIGRAVFADGRPVPKFSVRLTGYDGDINLFPGTTPSLGMGEGQNGFYAVQTTDTQWHKKPVAGLVTGVALRAEIPYAGKPYTLSLCPLDGLPEGGGKGEFKGMSGPGVVRDFVVKIAGVRPAWKDRDLDENNGPDERGTFYGAQLNLDLSRNAQVGFGGDTVLNTAPVGSKVVVTLVPQGPLLDGTTGQTVVRTVTLRKSKDIYYLRNIPIGQYTASAQLETPDGQSVPLNGTLWKNVAATTTVLFPLADAVAAPVSFYVVR